MVSSGYTNAAIPNDLAARVDRLVKRSDLGYRSRQEFITDAVRRHLLSLEKSEAPPPAATQKKGD
jgi:metal-responsive CopG/Arc/MetJ family transcriptional regulator